MVLNLLCIWSFNVISVVTLLCSIEMEKKKIESHLIGPRMSNTYIAVCGWAYSPINSIKIQRG